MAGLSPQGSRILALGCVGADYAAKESDSKIPRTCVSASADGTVCAWDVDDGYCTARRSGVFGPPRETAGGGRRAPRISIACLGGGSRCAISCGSDAVLVLELPTLRTISVLQSRLSTVEALAPMSCGDGEERLLAVDSRGNRFEVWDSTVRMGPGPPALARM